MENTKTWGYHAVLDIAGCNLDAATNPEVIKEFAKQLVKDIDMVPYGEPQIVHFADHLQDKAGWTLIQLIETSNIMAHFIDSNGDCYMDVFSCKHFNIEDVLKCIDKYFKPKSVYVHPVFKRTANRI